MAARITSAVALLGLLAALAVPTAAQEAGGPVVERWAGNDRYATAAAVADGAFDDAVDRVFLATGVDFADALAAGPATRGTAPILLTSPESLPPATASGLQRLSPREVVILGGDAAVSDDVAEAVASLTGADVVRIGGRDRTETAAAVSEWAFPDGSATVYLATAATFPDALTGGVAAAMETDSAPILLTWPDALPAATLAAIERLGAERVVILGGNAAVPDTLLSGLPEQLVVDRLAGADRLETAAAVSRAAFESAGTVFLATADDFPDALAGTAAAIAERGPILLVDAGGRRSAWGRVDPTAAELARLRPDRIVVLGGEAAVPGEAVDALLGPLGTVDGGNGDPGDEGDGGEDGADGGVGTGGDGGGADDAGEGDEGAPPAFAADQTRLRTPLDVASGLAVDQGADRLRPTAVAIVSGRVVDRDTDLGLPEVEVSVLGRPEHGVARTSGDGTFSLALDGGQAATVVFAADGYLQAQRTLHVPTHGWEVLPDVALVALDEQASEIHLDHPTYQVHQSSESHDGDGRRRTTILVPPGTTATFDGGAGPSTLTLRATEYTVGPNGEAAMPGLLPLTIAYTFAAELSADEALSAGVERVQFSQPLPVYVENFLDFPVGTDVPLGYYDRGRGAWVPAPDGRVLGILGVDADGRAILDVDGDGEADDAGVLEDLGISDDERGQLALLYTPGTTLWRSPIDHFTPWDCNWPYSLPADARPPRLPTLTGQVAPFPETVKTERGTIALDTQSLTESLPLEGTSMGLAYDSRRQLDGSGRRVSIPLEGSAVPGSVRAIHVRVAVAGQELWDGPVDAASTSLDLIWDGRDRLGGFTQGTAPLVYEISYEYAAVYTRPQDFAASFGRAGGATPIADRTRGTITLTRAGRAEVQALDWRAMGLGGWQLTDHHTYDTQAGVVHMGDGGTQSAVSVNAVIDVLAGPEPPVSAPGQVLWTAEGVVFSASDGTSILRRGDEGTVEVLAGTGTRGSSPDGTTATAAAIDLGRGIGGGLAQTVDGRLLFAETGSGLIRTIEHDGSLGTFAGSGEEEAACDVGEGPAHQIAFGGRPLDLATTSDGYLYVSDPACGRVLVIDQDGWVTVAVDAADLAVGASGPDAAVAVAVGPDDRLHLATDGNRILVRGGDGALIHIGGDGGGTSDGDGGPATAAGFFVEDLAVAPDGTVYVAEPPADRVRAIGPDGIVHTAAGPTGERAFCCFSAVSNGSFGQLAAASGDGEDGAVAFGDIFEGLGGIGLSPAGELVIAEHGRDRVLRIVEVFPEFDASDIVVPSPDGTLLLVFDPTGRHLETRHGLTRGLLRSFTYDDDGLLHRVEEPGGAITAIERHPDGTIAVIGPDGQRTELTLDDHGYLASLTDPGGRTVRLQHSSGGLLEVLEQPDGQQFTFGWSGSRVVRATNPAGETVTYRRAGDDADVTVTETSPDGDRTLRVRRDRAGTVRTTTEPDGSVTTTTLHRDGRVERTAPNGQVVTTTAQPDPRWGWQAPTPRSVTVETPDGRTATVETTITATWDGTELVALEQTSTANPDAGEPGHSRRYDAATRTFTHTTPEGRVLTTTVDDLGHVVVMGRPGDLADIRYERDERGRVVAIVEGEGADARVTAFTYDDAGLLVGITDPLGRQATFTHDDAGRLVEQVLPGDDRHVQFGYTDTGFQNQLVTPGDETWTITPDASGRVEHFASPSETTPAVHSSYDVNGRPITVQFGTDEADRLELTYDEHGLLSSIEIPHSTTTIDRSALDGGGRHIVLASSDGHGAQTVTRTYDGSLAITTEWTGPVTGTVERHVDDEHAFRTAGWSVHGELVEQSHDLDGLLVSAGPVTLHRSAANGLIGQITAGDVTEQWSSNEFGERSRMGSQFDADELLTLTATRDALGRIVTQVEGTGEDARTTTYAYTPEGWLASATTVDAEGDVVAQHTYDYDANGNLTLRDGVALQHGPGDELLGIGEDTAFTYGPDGALETRTDTHGTTTYDYDLLGGLRRVELADGTGVDYVLDGENRRVARIVDGETTHRWLYQDGLKIIAEVDADGEVVTRYVYASDDRVPDVMIREGRTYRILRDLLGSVRLVVDVATGDVAQELAYDPYGLVLRDTNPGFQPWGFAGGLHDHVTGLVRFGTRDYDPTTARWTAPDPLGFAPGQTNLYAYVGGDPVNRIDPLGGQYEVSSDAVAETMWALAYEEFRIGGHANMKDAYGTVDITEHALFGDPSLKSYAPPLPWNSAPYNHLIETGGRFLPERNHNIKLPNGNLLDLRWFMQGYLSDGLGQTWKTAGGHLYNGLDTTSDNAIINNMSLQAGMDAHNSGLSLADVAQSWVGDPPPGNAWRQGTSSLPGDAPPSYDYNPYW